MIVPKVLPLPYVFPRSYTKSYRVACGVHHQYPLSSTEEKRHLVAETLVGVFEEDSVLCKIAQRVFVLFFPQLSCRLTAFVWHGLGSGEGGC